MKRMLMILAVLLMATSTMAAPLAGVTAIDASGQLGSTWAKEKSVDGDVATFWYSNINSGTPAPYITYDLGTTTILDSLAITMSNGNFRKLAIADVMASTDGTNFSSLGQHSVDITNGAVTNIDVANTSAAYVKIVGVGAFYSNWSPQYTNAVDGASDGKYAISFAEITFEAVPEPASMALLAMGGLLAIARRR